MFTQQHFVGVASCIADTLHKIEHDAQEDPRKRLAHWMGARTLAYQLCDLFARDNPKFKRDAFERMAGLR